MFATPPNPHSLVVALQALTLAQVQTAARKEIYGRRVSIRHTGDNFMTKVATTDLFIPAQAPSQVLSWDAAKAIPVRTEDAQR